LILVFTQSVPGLLPVDGVALKVVTLQRLALGHSANYAAETTTKQIVGAFQLVAAADISK